MNTSRLSSKYQIVVPKEVRDKMKLIAGTELSVYSVDETHAVIMKQPKSHSAALRGLGKEIWQALGGTEKYIKGERASWDKKLV